MVENFLNTGFIKTNFINRFSILLIMKGKRGSAGEWMLVILLVLVVGAVVLFISSNIFYTKSEVEDLVNSSVSKASCEYLNLMDDSTFLRYSGQTPMQICQNIDKKPKFLFVREVVNVVEPLGHFVIYQDENYIVEPSFTSLFLGTPLGPAEDLEFTQINGYKKEVNRFTAGLLCCG